MAASSSLGRMTLLGKVRTFRPLLTSATPQARARAELTLPADNPRSSFPVNRQSGSFTIDPFIRSARYYAAITAPASLDREVEKETSPKLERAAGRNKKTFLERLRTETNHFIPAHLVTAVCKDLIGTKKAVSPDDALLLLGCFAPCLAEETAENRVKMAEKAFTDLKTVGTQFDVRHYNALLKVYLENGHPFDPEDFLLIISEDGIEMNEETYSLFVQRYCQTGNVGDAMRTLEFMKSKGIKMNRQLFHALIAGHLRIGDLDGVENLRAMLKKSYGETSQDFLPILSTHARMGNVDKVLDTFIDMKGPLTPDCQEVWSVLTAYTDWCIEENKYPESSALDSFFDMAKDARMMQDYQSHLARTVVHLHSIGFHEIAVRLLTLHPQYSKMALGSFFRSAIRTLPFTDVSRYCDMVIEAGVSSDPLGSFCIPEMKLLPFDLLQQILVDAKECDLSLDIISEVVKSKLPAFSEDMNFPTRRTGIPVEKVVLLAIQLELPFINDQRFWEEQIFEAGFSFEQLYQRLLRGASSLDKKLIDSCKPTMMNGFIQRCMRKKLKNRLKTIANLIRAHPDFELSLNHNEIAYRLCLKNDDAIEATLDDAIYILSRMRDITGYHIGSILFALLKRNPDAKLICNFISHAKDENLPCPYNKFFQEAFELVKDPIVEKALISYHDHCRKKVWIDTKVIVRLTLPELVRMAEGNEKSYLLDELICVKAAAVCDEQTALDALSRINPNRQKPLSSSLIALIDMYVYGIGNVDEALKCINRLFDNCRDIDVELSSATCLRIIELSIQSGKSLGDSILWNDLSQNNFSLKFPYGNHDRQIVLDHIEFVMNLSEERDDIEAYLVRLTNLGLGSSIPEHHVAFTLKNDGVKEAVELIKIYFNRNSKVSDGKIPNEERVLDAIVASEDVGLLKEFIDISYAVNGERNAFLSLAFALYKGGKYTQGKRILNIPGLRSDEGMVTEFCNKMLMEKHHEALETFCEDVCCLYGTDKSELSFFKLQSLICHDKLKALEYYSQVTTGPFSSTVTKKIQELGSNLYKSHNLEFTDKSVIVEDGNDIDDVNLKIDVASPLKGNLSQILRGIRNGEKFDFEFYLEVVTNILASDPSPVVDALVDTENIPALEFLISSKVPVQSDLALVYIRQGRFEELLNICQGSENPECYLTATNLLLIGMKDGTDQVFSLIEALVENEKSVGLPLLGNLVNYHLYSNNLEKAKELLEKNPLLLEGSKLPLANINTYSPFLLLTELDAPSLDKRNLFYRMIMVCTTLKISHLIEDSFKRMREANVDIIPHKSLRRRVRDVVGKDLFSNTNTMAMDEDDGVEQVVDFADTIDTDTDTIEVTMT